VKSIYSETVSAYILVISYLTNRRQNTVLQNYESELEYVTYSVPQGSVHGPFLFLIYVNDIQYAMTNAKI